MKQVLTTMKEVAQAQQHSTAGQGRDVPLYTFCTPSAQWASKLLADAPVPRCIRRGGTHSEEGQEEQDSGVGAVDAEHESWPFEIQFYLGSAGTGAPAHFHGHAINSLAYGEKVNLPQNSVVARIRFGVNYCIFLMTCCPRSGCCTRRCTPSTAPRRPSACS